jgi:hypothetical protein
MGLQSTKTVSGTITVDDLLVIGIKVEYAEVINGNTRTQVPGLVGYAKYKVDGEDGEKEITFPVVAAEKTAVKDAIKTKAIAAIRAREGV